MVKPFWNKESGIIAAWVIIEDKQVMKKRLPQFIKRKSSINFHCNPVKVDAEITLEIN